MFNKVNLDKAKLWYFENHGSANGYRDVGNEYVLNSTFNGIKKEWVRRINNSFSKYCKYNIPKDTEAEWEREIQKETLASIEITANRYELFMLFIKLDMLEISKEERVYPIINYLKGHSLDTFTTILLCEILVREKKYNLNDTLNSAISDTINFYSQKLLSQSIIIDESYKKASHMQDYDFSEENIRNRINSLLN